MPKAILELEMPESCKACILSLPYERKVLICAAKCVPGILDVRIAQEGRRPDCPLKLVEGKEDEDC